RDSAPLPRSTCRRLAEDRIAPVPNASDGCGDSPMQGLRAERGGRLYGRGYSGGGLGFGPPVTPPVVKQLLIANLVVFFAQFTIGGFIERFAASPIQFWRYGQIWQPFTYMWLHAGLGHLAANMFALWMFGSPVALVWGPRRFLRFYLICGVGA